MKSSHFKNSKYAHNMHDGIYDPSSYAWGYIRPEQLYQIYELEYKASQVLKQAEFLTGYSHDDKHYRYHYKLIQELEKLVDELILDFFDAFNDFMQYHLQYHSELWLDKYRSQVLDAYSLLRDSLDSGNLRDKLKAINVAKSVVHGGGDDIHQMMGLYTYRYDLYGRGKPDEISEEAAKSFYSALSDGEFIEKWDNEMDEDIKRMSCNKNWYKIALEKEAVPYIHEVQPHIYEIGEHIKSIEYVKSVYIFGSFVDQGGYPDYKMKDLDIVAVVDFTEEQMRQCVFGEEFFGMEICEEVREFTENFINIYPKYNLDPWAITSDEKLLHWGPLADEDDLLHDEIKNVSWETAYHHTEVDIKDYGFDKPEDINEEDIDAIEDENLRQQIKDFYEAYHSELDNIMYAEFNHGPFGWYSFGDSLTTQYILENGLKIA